MGHKSCLAGNIYHRHGFIGLVQEDGGPGKLNVGRLGLEGRDVVGEALVFFGIIFFRGGLEALPERRACVDRRV